MVARDKFDHALKQSERVRLAKIESMEAQIRAGTASNGQKLKYENYKEELRTESKLKAFEKGLARILFHNNWFINRAVGIAQEKAKELDSIKLELSTLRMQQSTA